MASTKKHYTYGSYILEYHFEGQWVRHTEVRWFNDTLSKDILAIARANYTIWRIRPYGKDLIIAQSKQQPDDTPPAVQPETTEAERPGLTPAALGEYATRQEAPVDYAPPVYSDFEMIDPDEDYDSYIARKERDSLVNPDNAHMGTWDYEDAVGAFEANLPAPDPEPPTPNEADYHAQFGIQLGTNVYKHATGQFTWQRKTTTTTPRTSPAPAITGHGRSASFRQKRHKQAKPRTRQGSRKHANMQRRNIPPRPSRRRQTIRMAAAKPQPAMQEVVIATRRIGMDYNGHHIVGNFPLKAWQHVKPVNSLAAIVARELAAKEVDLTAAFRAAYRNAPKRLGGKAA